MGLVTLGRFLVVLGGAGWPGKFLILLWCGYAVIETFNGAPFNLGIQFFLDGANHCGVIGGYQGKGIAGFCSTPGTTDAVDISLGGIGDVIVYHV